MTYQTILPDIGLSPENRSAVVLILNGLLGDVSVLYVKTRSAHWNVRGLHFHHLHGLFEEQYGELARIGDEVAERVRILGGQPISTMTEFLEHTRLLELSPEFYPNTGAILEDLLQCHERVIHGIRAAADVCEKKHGDVGTTDLLTGVLEKHEKMAWVLRTSLEDFMRDAGEVSPVAASQHPAS
ncbi:DNA starvation/stationary phase protection protein [Candidatus Sumerlaeota bacterium]|nr:DNA starvation/stationary phase protection protein [Candidatus Sumerlaeota bacterium]